MENAARPVPRTRDDASAFVAVGEMLWWFTAADNAIRERHALTYNHTRDHLVTPNPKTLVRGLHHARNRFAHGLNVVQFVEPTMRQDELTAYKWCAIPRPENDRYLQDFHAYEEAMKNCNVWHTFVDSQGFLRLVAKNIRECVMEGADTLTVEPT
jgi:hypothetical protein